MAKILLSWWLAIVVACTGQGSDAYIVEGVVVEVKPGEVVLDHEEIDGLMPAMVMAFPVPDGVMPSNLEPGHRVIARYLDQGAESRLDKIRITGKGPAPRVTSAPVKPGETWPGVDVPVHDGGTLRIGEGQRGAILLTFLYTRCPLPEYCPATVTRYQALQGQLAEAEPSVGAEGPTLLAITLDPDYDTLARLAKYAADVGATSRWKFGRVNDETLADLARRAGMNVMPDGDQIAHGLRVLVLGGDGRLVERYDSLGFETARVLEQLGVTRPSAEP